MVRTKKFLIAKTWGDTQGGGAISKWSKTEKMQEKMHVFWKFSNFPVSIFIFVYGCVHVRDFTFHFQITLQYTLWTLLFSRKWKELKPNRLSIQIIYVYRGIACGALRVRSCVDNHLLLALSVLLCCLKFLVVFPQEFTWLLFYNARVVRWVRCWHSVSARPRNYQIVEGTH